MTNQQASCVFCGEDRETCNHAAARRLKEVEEKAREACPETAHYTLVPGIRHVEELQLHHILRAIGEMDGGYFLHMLLHKGGTMLRMEFDENSTDWNLLEPLSGQSESTILFLRDILCAE